MNFEELQKKVIEWANKRELIQKDNSFKQYAKVIEEVGEIGTAMLKQDKNKVIDGLGDTVVTLIILAEQQGYDLKDCLKVAYEEIKDRKGQTVNGTFIKES